MKQEIAKELVYNLRSEEYEQTRLNLRDTEGFCPLGILCDMYAKAFGATWEHPIFVVDDTEEIDDLAYVFLDESEVLPLEVMEWAGMNSRKGAIPKLNTSIMQLNDGGGTQQVLIHSFKEIADIIEQNWEDL